MKLLDITANEPCMGNNQQRDGERTWQIYNFISRYAVSGRKNICCFFFIANNYSLTEGNRYIMLLEFLINKTIKKVL